MTTFSLDSREFSGKRILVQGSPPRDEAVGPTVARSEPCHYPDVMAQQAIRSRAPVNRSTERQFLTPESGAQGVEEVLSILEGRWKLLILFHLFGRKVRRFSELERAIPAVSQKMLTQQLRQLERDGVVRRIVYAQVPPKVEYGLTDWGQALCPVLDALLKWSVSRAKLQPTPTAEVTRGAGA